MRAPAQRTPYRASDVPTLLTAAVPATGPARWEEGFTYPSAPCGSLASYDPCSAAPRTVLLDRGMDGGQSFLPYPLQSWAECSVMGSEGIPGDVRAQATEQLDALTAWGVEREFWTGNLSRTYGWHNRSLVATDADVADDHDRAVDLTPAGNATTGVSPLATVGLLEEALGSMPGRGYLHVGSRGGPFLGTQASVTGNMLRTKLGSVIVPGAGYPGTGPDGTAAPAGTTWVFATGPVTVRLTPSVVPADDAEVIDRALNRRRVLAERLAAATWDGCAHYAVLMTLKSD